MLGPLITKPCFRLYPRCKDSEFPSPTVVTGPYAEMWVPFRSASVLCRKPAREACCIKALFNPADFTGCLWPGTSVFAALKCHLKSLTTVGEANKTTQRSRQLSGAGPAWYPLHRHDYNIRTCSWGDHHSVSGYPFPRLCWEVYRAPKARIVAQSMASDVVLRFVVKTWAELSQWFAQFCMATFIDATRNLFSDLLGTCKSKTAEFKSPWESHLGTFVCWQVCSRNSQTHLQDDKQISQPSGKIQYHAMSWQKATGSWRSYISYQARQEYQHPQPHSPPLSRELPETSLTMVQGCAGSQGNEIKKKKKA